ncbi:DUF192 domain-containing protein [uncultured Marinobacter sp.]|uniref:DUF192 domain-containing protein n=1 Tax=uncultured Marinobacter sp. TaxID=187379 RepID=UPI002616AA1C|nr:DUF192 domain-containing protein [uncultured Marinobacter sp.]
MSRTALALITTLFIPALVVGQTKAEDSLPIREACLISSHGITPIRVEMAITESERRKGLMGRTSLAPNTGMLFIYEEPREPERGFWMHRTLIPLDIAYLDDQGTIKAIKQMFPCKSTLESGCPVYRAGVSFSGALEMNQFFFRNNGISVGDRVSTSESICKH